MNYKECIENARPRLGKYCKACPECNGRACKNQMPAEYGEKVANAVASGEFDCGILICGTGVGISIAANKVNGIRAAVCSDTATARLVKQHNNANIIAFGERIVGVELAKDIVKAYLTAEFEGGRHAKRIAMISDIEARN